MEQIGEGGFGLVFVAEQQQPVKRRVALKVIKPGMDTRDVIARFEAERQALALMDHANIARVFDAGATDSGRPYFVMELVHGIPITDYRDQNQLTPRERLKLFVSVCQAVQHAHQKGIIHRDIKPSNVLVTLHDDQSIVKVIDFGVAKALYQPLTDKTIYTRFAQMIGTPLYMSPEQAEMGGLDIDTRSDVYSLGVLLYELLTGTTPFDKKRLAKAAYDELIRMIREEEPPKPSTRLSQSTESLPAIAAHRNTEPAKLSKMFRGDLDWITMKAMEKNRTRRYETASAFAADIVRYLNDEPVEASPPSSGYRLKKLALRHRTALITVTAFVSLLMAGVIVSTWLEFREKAARLSADQNAQIAEEEAQKARDAQSIAEDEKHKAEIARAEAVENAQRAERRLDLALGAVENFRSAVDGNLDVKNRPENDGLRKTLLQAPLAFYQKLRDDLRKGGGASLDARAKLGDAYLNLAALDRDIGSQADALKAYDEAAALFEPLFREAPQARRAEFRARLARALGERGKLQGDSRDMTAGALTSLRRARELQEAAIRENPDDIAVRVGLASTLDDLAGLESRKGDVDAALATLGHSLGVLEEGRHRTPRDIGASRLLARTHLQVSQVLSDQSRLPEGLASAGTALQIAEPLAQANPGDVECQRLLSVAYARLGKIHQAKGELDKALEVYGKRLAIVEKMIRIRPTVNQFKLERVEALDRMASAQCELGQNAEGLANLQKGRDFAAALVRDNPTNTSFKKSLNSIWNRMAMPLYALGRTTEAVSAIEGSAAVLEEVNRADPDDVAALQALAGAQYNCGVLNAELGRVDAALAAYDRSLVLRERLARAHPDSPAFALDVSSTLGNIGSIQTDRNRLAEARVSFQRAPDNLQKLVAEHPENAQYQSFFLRARRNVGNVLTQMGQSSEAIKVLLAAQEPTERLAREHPGVIQYQDDLVYGLRYLSEALRKAGKLNDAMMSCRKAIEIRERLLKLNPGDPNSLRELIELLTVQADLERDRQHPAAAVKSFRSAVKLLEGVSTPSPPQLYDLGRYRARLAAAAATEGSGMTAEEIRAEADQAIAALSRAVAAGFHEVEQITKDNDWNNLRNREDFKELLHKSETPPSRRK